MKEIVVIAPIQTIYDRARALVEQQGYHNVDVVFGNMSKGVQVAERCIAEGAKIIVSRGGTYRLIKKAHPVPVVEIKVDAYDIVESYEKVAEDAEEIAVVGYRNIIYGFDVLQRLMDKKIVKIELREESEVNDIILAHKERGIQTYIGDANIVPIINALGCHGIVIQSRSESILTAIQEARRVARATKLEKKRTQQLLTTTDFIHDGVIAVNESGIITLFNKRAEEIFQIPKAEALGRHLSEITDDTELLEVLQTKTPQLRQLHRVKNVNITVNRVPILVDGESQGAVATFQEVTEVQRMERQIRRELSSKGFVARYTFDDIVYRSEAIGRCIETAKQYARYDTPVHICGGSGVGKELFCQSIHNASTRRNGPFVAINCASIAPSLIESEFFGYAEGSFTGAMRHGRQGLFEIAHEGTLFLDEISELPLDLQSRLLRVLQEKRVLRVGGSKMIPVNVRVITASNRYLGRMMQEGTFRKDLYYRINILTLRIPDLNRRREDIPVLSDLFLEKYAKLYGKRPPAMGDEVRQALLRFDYQGNVRELEGMMERSVILDSFDELLAESRPPQPAPPKIEEPVAGLLGEADEPALHSMERAVILRVLDETGGNMQKTAQKLGISRTTLWRKLQNFRQS